MEQFSGDSASAPQEVKVLASTARALVEAAQDALATTLAIASPDAAAAVRSAICDGDATFVAVIKLTADGNALIALGLDTEDGQPPTTLVHTTVRRDAPTLQ